MAESKVRRWGRKSDKAGMPASTSASAQRMEVASSAKSANAQRMEVASSAKRHTLPQSMSSTVMLDGLESVKGLGAGDSFLIPNFLADAEADASFHSMLPEELGGAGEMSWVQMYSADGRPLARLKNTQTENCKEGLPIYRYPTNNQDACVAEPWSETVKRLRDAIEKVCGHSMNHCVGNLYRHESDYIGPHKDKMLDILKGTSIASLSFGQQRPIVLECDGIKQVVPLHHGSLFIIGPETNQSWTHAIPKQDHKCGPRISLTIRLMGTFLNMQTDEIVGQGAKYQEKNWPLFKHDLSVVPTVLFPRRVALQHELRAEHIEGGSTFLCIIRPCVTVAEAESLHQQLILDFPQACHIPFAWICRRSRSKQAQPSQGKQASRTLTQHQGSNNHGEPHVVVRGTETIDTAASGILSPLRASHLTDCAAFVVRHWDGEKLGLKRLVAAYRAAALLALEQSHPSEAADMVSADVEFGPKLEKEAASQQPLCSEEKSIADKTVRKLQKLIREIQALEERVVQGETLKPNQMSKIGRKAAISAELQGLLSK